MAALTFDRVLASAQALSADEQAMLEELLLNADADANGLSDLGRALQVAK
jgi:hypothetical protein